ncbi:MAG: tRNA(Ile)-lysidine synthase [Methanoregulaceae archaeon]|nr:tRNA(Ile)-lysidine synthase [Methanoregulaceae archaeon]
MDCDKCGRAAIIYQRYSGKHLCNRHFQEDCEKKAKRVIRKHSWIHPGDRIGIAMSGGVHSTALAHFLSSLLSRRRDIDLVALTIDEGIVHFREPARARDTAYSLGIPWYMTSFREISGVARDLVMRREADPGLCSRCRLLRMQSLTILAAEHGVTRIALGSHLDDCAGSVLRNILRGEPARPSRLPVPGEVKIPLMTPFMEIPGREVALYAILCHPGLDHSICPYSDNTFRADVSARLNEYSYHHPATRYALGHLGEELRKREGLSGRKGDSPGNEDPVVSSCMEGKIPRVSYHDI